MTADPTTATGITIRTATPDDIPALVAMVNAAYRKAEGHVFPTTERVQRTAAMNNLSRIAVAIIDGRVVGSIDIELAGDVAHFGMLATDLAYQRRGIASMLIAHAEETARGIGCRVMRLETIKEAGNEPFYERFGYRVTAETDGQTWNGGQDWGAAGPWHMVDMEKPL